MPTEGRGAAAGIDTHKWLLAFAGALALASFLIYVLQYFLFHNSHEMWVWIINSFAFVPVDVILTALIVERLLHSREKDAQRHKQNMVIGAFFSEAGNELLARLTPAADEVDEIRSRLNVRAGWKRKDFETASRFALAIDPKMDVTRLDLASLKQLLDREREFLVRLLENPMLLEHERFTDLLWAVFHLSDELDARPDLKALPPADARHIAGDIQRAYTRLMAVWVRYVSHLSESYPYLFSLVARTHPFQEKPSPVVYE